MSDSLKTARPQSFSVWALDLPISHFPPELKLGEVTMMAEGRSMSDKKGGGCRLYFDGFGDSGVSFLATAAEP